MLNSQIPTELVERIIDHVADSDRALRVCGLVARCWRPRALSHMFRSIEVVSRCVQPRTDWLVFGLNSFAHFLSDVPHLAVYLRRFSLRVGRMSAGDFEHLLLLVLDSQSAMPFDWEVKQLFLSGLAKFADSTLELATSALPAAFPSVHSLSLAHHRSTPIYMFKLAAGFAHLHDLHIRAGGHQCSGRPDAALLVETLPLTLELRQVSALRVSLEEGCVCGLGQLLSALKQRTRDIVRLQVKTTLRQLDFFCALPKNVDLWIDAMHLELARLQDFAYRVYG